MEFNLLGNAFDYSLDAVLQLQGKRPSKKRNWIGGSNLTDAAFIPPHHENVPELMGDLEKFWHNEEIIVPKWSKLYWALANGPIPPDWP